MQKYSTCKQTGIEWLGEVPSHWKIEKFKRLLKEPLRYGANESGEYENRDEPRYIRITDFDNDGKLRENTFKSLPKDIANDYLLQEGDLLFARSGATSGKVFLFKNYTGEACFAGYLIKAVCDDKYLNYDFMYYYTQSYAYETWKGMIFTQSTIQNISADKYSLLPVPVPTLREQVDIVTYLNEATAKIDKVIATKQRQLKQLDQYKKSTIHEVITEGISKNIELKDSGIDWIEKVPKHWKISKIKHIANLQSGDTITSETIYETGEYPVYGGNGFRGYTTHYTHDGFYSLIGRQGALCGNINYANGKFWASEHAVVVTILDSSETIWLGELLRIMNLNQYSQAAAQPGLAVETIKNLKIPIPPKSEQKQIVDYITHISTLVQKEREIIEKQVSCLQQYRKSLIHECVTGKRKVAVV